MFNLDEDSFIFGLDLGQVGDYTALTILEREIRHLRGNPTAFYFVKYLKRFPLNLPYPKVVSAVKRMLNDPEARPNRLVVDATGVGRAVVDMFRNEGLDPFSITITGGNTVTQQGNYYNVPKRDLVGAVQILAQNGQLRIAGDLSEAETLKKELVNFRMKITKTGQDTYDAWRENVHDDLVLSVALACWYVNRTAGLQYYTRMNKFREPPKKANPTRTNT